MFPRAASTNLLASSPMVVMGLASSATAVQNARSVSFGEATTGTGVAGAGIMVLGGGVYRSARDANDPSNTTGTGLLGVGLLLFDGTNWQRPTVASGIDGSLFGNYSVACALGSSLTRLRAAAASVISATTQAGALLSADPGEWTVNSSVAAAGTPSGSKAAGAAGVIHVCRNVSITLANVNAAASALITINLRDGATGAGIIKRTWQIVVPGGSTVHIPEVGLNIFGTAATAMTLESAAALPADVSGVCAFGGYSTI